MSGTPTEKGKASAVSGKRSRRAPLTAYRSRLRGGEVWRERLAQQPERARHLGLDGLHREVERVGNLLVGEAFLAAHGIYQAAPGREALDGALHRAEQLVVLELRRWRGLTGFGIGLVVYPALLDPLAAYPV